jgi:hypothetical protein
MSYGAVKKMTLSATPHLNVLVMFLSSQIPIAASLLRVTYQLVIDFLITD